MKNNTLRILCIGNTEDQEIEVTCEEFESDNTLICPKCSRELRHYGVDYDRSGNALHCENCSNIVMEPSVGFICTDCEAHTPGETIKTINWNHYTLTPSGQSALMYGRIPKKTFSEIFSNLRGVYTRHDFLVVSFFIRENAVRYKRELSSFKIDISNMDKVRKETSNLELNLILAMVAEVISQILRTTDAVTIVGDSLFTIMNEIPPSNANILLIE